MTFEVVALANKNESILIHIDVRLAYFFNTNPVPGTFSFSILCRRSWLKTEGLQPAPGPGGVWLQEGGVQPGSGAVHQLDRMACKDE